MSRYRGYKKSVPSVDKPQVFTFSPIADEMRLFKHLAEETPFTDREVKHLFDILKTRRPHGEDFTEQVVKALIDPYLPEGFETDEVGNRIVKIGESETLFSCHVDTVHWDPGLQHIAYNKDSRIIYKTDGECLGADDGTGIWIMLMMIQREVPGLYVFHVGEETGGVGSKHIAEKRSELLLGVRRAVAFDRKGTTDVINQQRGRACCSKEFADALSEQLSDETHKWRPTSGSFTDTANYMSWVPECTNLSVGYQAQHTANETQDIGALLRITEQFLTLDWEALPTVRDPFAKPKVKKSAAGRHPSLTGGWDAWGEWYDSRDSKPGKPGKPEKPADLIVPAADDVFINALDASERFLTLAEIKKLVHRYPEIAAQILYTSAVDFRDVEAAIGHNQGYKQRVISSLTKRL